MSINWPPAVGGGPDVFDRYGGHASGVRESRPGRSRGAGIDRVSHRNFRDSDLRQP